MSRVRVHGIPAVYRVGASDGADLTVEAHRQEAARTLLVVSQVDLGRRPVLVLFDRDVRRRRVGDGERAIGAVEQADHGGYVRAQRGEIDRYAVAAARRRGALREAGFAVVHLVLIGDRHPGLSGHGTVEQRVLGIDVERVDRGVAELPLDLVQQSNEPGGGGHLRGAGGARRVIGARRVAPPAGPDHHEQPGHDDGRRGDDRDQASVPLPRRIGRRATRSGHGQPPARDGAETSVTTPSNVA